MELKDFIIASVAAIIEASKELSEKYSPLGVILNPPAYKTGDNVSQTNSGIYTYRRVQDVEFDVALTASSSSSGGAGGGIKIFSAEVGAHGEVSKLNEQISRVRFKIPLALAPSIQEGENIEQKKLESDKREQQRLNARIDPIKLL